MKVILSRKGFDSVNGGIVSPILEDGTMISFPIPSTDANTYSELEYNGIPYPQLLHDLNYNEGKFGFHCHIDPDLDASRRKNKPTDWFPAFGQINASASYLRNIGIAPGISFSFSGTSTMSPESLTALTVTHGAQVISIRTRICRSSGAIFRSEKFSQPQPSRKRLRGIHILSPAGQTTEQM